jgi:hypothetical protein
MVKVYFKNRPPLVMTTGEFAKIDRSTVIMHHPWNFGDSPDDWFPKR